MKTRMSALMDGELDAVETCAVMRAMRGNRELHTEWVCFQHISATLRGETEASVDVVSKVMAALESEPTVLAPAPKRLAAEPARSKFASMRPLMALTASAAGVALVAWVALSSDLSSQPASGSIASGRPAAQTSIAAAQNKPKISPRMQEYLVAHQAHAPGSSIVGGVRNIRTVSASGEAR